MSPHIVIIGGGITGLAAAYALQQRAQAEGMMVEYTLLEASHRFGGKVVTEESEGFVIEGGPDSFLTQKPAALQLCRALGLDEDLIPIQEHRPSSYILRSGRLHPLPEGMNLLAPARMKALWSASLFSWPARVRIWWERYLPARRDEGDESLGAFARRRLGEEAFTFLAEPLFAGVHMADGNRLSMAAAFPRFPTLERQYGSLTRAARALTPAPRPSAGVRATPAFLTLRQGLQGLVQTLVSRLGGDLRLDAPVEAVAPLDPEQRRFTVRLKDGSSLAADAVIMTTLAPVTAQLVEGWNPSLGQRLRQLRLSSSATVSLAYEANAVRHPLAGTGFLVPRSEASRLTGCTWTSAKFAHRAPSGTVLLRAFVGGPRAPHHVDLDDGAMIAMVRQELGAIMGITAEPLVARVFRWREAHPQYDVGHLGWLEAAERECPPNLVLAGASYRGIGLPDCIAQGESAASHLIQSLAQSATVRRGVA